MSRYKLYVSTISYYSGKLEAYVRYKELPHDRVEITQKIFREILAHTGAMKIPAMQCPDGRWLKDTTPMIRWLDAQHPSGGIYPADPADCFIALLVEDYADEWLWRPAMHYRWSFPEGKRLLGRTIVRLVGGVPGFLLGLARFWPSIRQNRIFVHGDGIRPGNRQQVEALYERTLDELSALLDDQPFLHGARPGIVDFAYFASMFRHFGIDPEPAEIMRTRAPAVYEWVARLWNARASHIGDRTMMGFDGPGWDAVLEAVGREYLPYLDQNAAAWQSGRTRFDAHVAGVTYPAMPAVRYRVACREQILGAYAALDEAAQARVQARLARSGVGKWLVSAEPVASGLDQEFVMPLQPHYRKPTGWYGLRTINGTPWDMAKDAVIKSHTP